MKSREQFIERWKKHLAGLALFGTASEKNDGPLVRASKIFDLPSEVTALLGMMYDDIGITPSGSTHAVKTQANNATTLPKQTTVK